jgi:hypothetical protein
MIKGFQNVKFFIVDFDENWARTLDMWGKGCHYRTTTNNASIAVVKKMIQGS